MSRRTTSATKSGGRRSAQAGSSYGTKCSPSRSTSGRSASRSRSSRPECSECIVEGVKTRRPAKYEGNRCYTHWQSFKKAGKTKRQDAYVERTYGITGRQYAALYKAQGGVCYICRRAKGTGKRRLAVDHDHETGFVRGLLCATDNRDVIGHSKEEIEFFHRCIEYLQNPPAFAVIGKVQVPGFMN